MPSHYSFNVQKCSMESASEAKPKLAGGKRWWVGCLQAWLWSSTWDFRKTIRPRKLPVFCVFRNRKSLILESGIGEILLVESRILGRDPFNQNFRNFGPKLNGSVRSNRKSFEKTGPPFEVVLFYRSDRSWLNGSRPWTLESKNSTAFR